MRMTSRMLLAGLLLAGANTSAVHAAPTAAQRCEGAIELAAGKYTQCRLTAESKFSLSPDAAKRDDALEKCRVRLYQAFGSAAAKFGATNCTSATPGDYQSSLAQCSDDAAAGAVVGGSPRYVDNGDGTVTDKVTRLVWEKKTAGDNSPNLADPHDVDNEYTWGTETPPFLANGTAFLDFLGKLNGVDGSPCFAGRCDWRLPTLDELFTLPTCAAPCVDPIFGPAAPGYGSGTSGGGSSFYFLTTETHTVLPLGWTTKSFPAWYRAVRSGL